MFSSKVTVGIFLAVALLVVGCSSSNSTAPLAQFEPEIVNVQDNFSLQATGVENVSTVLSYDWPNSGTQATINHSTVIADGSATVTIFDQDNVQVYSSGLVSSLNENSSAGTAGTWRIVVTFVNCYGTINFGAQAL